MQFIVFKTDFHTVACLIPANVTKHSKTGLKLGEATEENRKKKNLILV